MRGHHYWTYINKKDYKGILYTTVIDKLDNVGGMDTFLERRKLLRLLKKK